jgi:dephospho-CoA kinase
MKKVCIVGGIGSGKSYICKLFADRGIPVFYFDDEAKKLYNNKDVVEKLLVTFKDEFTELEYDSSKIIKTLSKFIFKNPDKRKQLELLLKPYLWKSFDDACFQYKNQRLFISECATMLKSDDFKKFDEIIFVHADPLKRQEIVLKNRNMNSDDFYNRVSSQLSNVESIEILKKSDIKHIIFFNEFDSKSDDFVNNYLND